MKPFLKWAGNKYSIIERIRVLLPAGARLIEPFTGSGAVFLNTDYSSALLADSNADLIDLYKTLQKEGDKFIDYCSQFFTAHNNKPEKYYAFRAEFNRTKSIRRKAGLFLYLNRHGYNGLCRYNASGGFNVPFGQYAKPYFPAREMKAFYVRAQCAEFKTASFVDIMNQTQVGDVVYCDPPYVPLSSTANFTSYSAGGFTKMQQHELTQLAEKLAQRGVPVVISNHDTIGTLHDYRNAADIKRFGVKRTISCKVKNRTKAKELLALFKAA
jgi:DNA adenine methylase